MSNQKSLKGNIVLNIIYKLSSILFPILVYPYVSRVIMAENMGKVSFYNSLTNYIIMLGSLGISTYGVRVVAQLRDNKRSLSIAAKELLVINTAATGIALAVLFGAAFFSAKLKQNTILLAISCLQIVLAPFSMDWLYSGLEDYRYITTRSIAIKAISIVCIFTFVRQKDDFIIYAAINAFGYIGNYVFNLIHARKFIDIRIKAQLHFKKHINAVLILFASIMAVNIYTNVDTIMLGFINGDRAVGLYDVACKGKLVLLSLINAISAVLFPHLTHCLATGDLAAYNDILRKSIILVFDISIPMSLFFIFEAKDVILFLGGESYLDAVECMQILMPILIISGFSNITGNQILLPHGKDSAFLAAVIVGALVDVGLNVMLMPRYSLYGAAIATLIAELSQMLIQLTKSKEWLKGNVEWKELLKVILSAVTALLFVMLAPKSMTNSPVLHLIFYSFLFAAAYFCMLLLLKETFILELKSDLIRRLTKKAD